MYTEGVLVQVAETNLRDLIETAGRKFPNGNNDCVGMTIQIDPAVDPAETIEVIGANSASGFGIVLSNDEAVGPTFDSFRCGKVEHVKLKASSADLLARVQVETL